MIHLSCSNSDKLSLACNQCSLDGGCCHGAMPPLTDKRIKLLNQSGVRPDAVLYAPYKRLRLKEDGFCVLFENGRCTVHDIKPETCVAGPFTFDIKDGALEIYLKKESICPMVRYLLNDEASYSRQYENAVRSIKELIENLPESEIAEILKIEEHETVKVAEIPLDTLGLSANKRL